MEAQCRGVIPSGSGSERLSEGLEAKRFEIVWRSPRCERA
jgi:hypothetical protein